MAHRDALQPCLLLQPAALLHLYRLQLAQMLISFKGRKERALPITLFRSPACLHTGFCWEVKSEHWRREGVLAAGAAADWGRACAGLPRLQLQLGALQLAGLQLVG